MATPDVTAGQVMVGSRALLNDQNDQSYHNSVLLQYLKIAFRELRELLEESNIPVTNKTDTVLALPAGTTVVSFTSTPALPSNLVEIRDLWSRNVNTNPWYKLTKKEFLPPALEGIDYTEFVYWSWENNTIKLLPTTSAMDLKLEYIEQLSEIADENSILGIINGQTFLEARTAALAARYAEENTERAQDLDQLSQAAADRLINIENKAKQNIYVRRRPFRSAWKSRTSF